MENNENITRCKDCNAVIITDELSSHKCFDELNHVLVDCNDDTYSFDGANWYNGFSDCLHKTFSPKNKHPNTTPQDSTEPLFLNNRKDKCILYK